jgi:hypothetical protein
MKIGYFITVYLVSVGTTSAFSTRNLCICLQFSLNPLIFITPHAEAKDLCHQGLGVTLPICKT